MIVACLALLAAVAAAPAQAAAAAPDTSAAPVVATTPDTVAGVALRATGGITSLAADPARPVEPAGLAFDSFGRAYVSDASLRRLVRYGADGRPLGESGALGDDPGALRRPGAVATAGVVRVAVLDEERRRVVAYDLFGRFTGVAADLEALDDPVRRPVALASDRSGALYVADGDGDRVLVFDASGRPARTLRGAAGAPLRGVAGVAVAKRGDVFVSERMPGRIVRLDPTGATRAEWALPESTSAERLPLAVDDSLRVACADPQRGRIWLFDASGRVLAVADADAVSALAFGRDGALWAAERRARRLVRWELVPRGPAGER